tara:strand:- start:41 stop:244 length:204 start_codon:yes stop_codon:yes gene_type:complete
MSIIEAGRITLQYLSFNHSGIAPVLVTITGTDRLTASAGAKPKPLFDLVRSILKSKFGKIVLYSVSK